MNALPLPLQNLSLGDRWQKQVQLTPDAVALASGEVAVTYCELDARVTQLAQWFVREGLQPGDRVAIIWFNEINTVLIFLACFRAGLIALPIIWRIKPPELAYILGHARPVLCFVQPPLAMLFEQAQQIQAVPCRALTALPLLTADASDIPLPAVDPIEPALIIYTSGTTARPKGVTHSHVSLGAAIEMVWNVHRFKVTVTTTSMLHPSGLYIVVLPTLFLGGKVGLLPMFDPALTLDAIERWHVTALFLLPSMAQLMIVEQKKRPRQVSSLKLVASGGDTVPLATQEAFLAVFGVPLCEGLGMTESGPVVTNPPSAIRSGSVGICLPGVEARVLDRSGAPVPLGETGELVVRSPGNFIGYWNNPAETEASLQDGWLFTGDLVRADADGYYYFQGRKKQLIVREGYNIAPQEVEEALYQHPAVLMAGVFGLPDPLYGQRVIAAVALRPAIGATESELREFMAKNLNELKVPSRIWFLPALPLGLSGKVDRRALKEMAEKDPSLQAT